jgi:hypothetical protein
LDERSLRLEQGSASVCKRIAVLENQNRRLSELCERLGETFVKMLQGAPDAVVQSTCEHLEHLGKEFGYGKLADECAVFRAAPGNEALIARTGGGPTTIVMIGPTGAGKSALGNRLLRTTVFQTTQGLRGETTSTTMHEDVIRVPSVTEPQVAWLHRVIDTPGIGDTEGRDWEHFEATVKLLRDSVKEVNLIALVHPRGAQFGDDFHRTLKMLIAAFEKTGASLWDHVCLVVTRCDCGSERQWLPGSAELCQECKRHIREIIQECTEGFHRDPDIPVFLVETSMDILDKCSERRFLGNAAVGKWLRGTTTQAGSPFRGWQDLGPNVDPLVRARFSFLLLEEWARSLPAVSMTDLQIPRKEFFRQRTVTETEYKVSKDPVNPVAAVSYRMRSAQEGRIVSVEKITRTGRRLLGWEKMAKWSDPAWDGEAKSVALGVVRRDLPWDELIVARAAGALVGMGVGGVLAGGLLGMRVGAPAGGKAVDLGACFGPEKGQWWLVHRDGDPDFEKAGFTN